MRTEYATSRRKHFPCNKIKSNIFVWCTRWKNCKTWLSVSVTPTEKQITCLLAHYLPATFPSVTRVCRSKCIPRRFSDVLFISHVPLLFSSYSLLLVCPLYISSAIFPLFRRWPCGGIAMKSENIGERSDAHVAHAIVISSQFAACTTYLASRSLSVTEILAHLSTSAKGHLRRRSVTTDCLFCNTLHSSRLIIDHCITLTEAQFTIATWMTLARDTRDELPSWNENQEFLDVSAIYVSEFSTEWLHSFPFRSEPRTDKMKDVYTVE